MHALRVICKLSANLPQQDWGGINLHRDTCKYDKLKPREPNLLFNKTTYLVNNWFFFRTNGMLSLSSGLPDSLVGCKRAQWCLLKILSCAEQREQITRGNHRLEQHTGRGSVVKGNPPLSRYIISSTQQVTHTADQKTEHLTGMWRETFCKAFQQWRSDPANYCSPVPCHVGTKKKTIIGTLKYDCDKNCGWKREKLEKAPSVCY